MYRCYKNLAPMVSYGRQALMRPVMVAQQKNFWNFPRPNDFRLMLRDIDRQFDRFDQEMQSFFKNTPINSMLSRALPVGAIDTASNTYRINIDVNGFKPEDVKLTLKDSLLTIEAKMEQKSEDGSRLYQEMSRAYTLPENIDAANLKSVLTSDGILAIEAPLTGDAAKPKEIPINRTEAISAK